MLFTSSTRPSGRSDRVSEMASYSRRANHTDRWCDTLCRYRDGKVAELVGTDGCDRSGAMGTEVLEESAVPAMPEDRLDIQLPRQPQIRGLPVPLDRDDGYTEILVIHGSSLSLRAVTTAS